MCNNRPHGQTGLVKAGEDSITQEPVGEPTVPDNGMDVKILGRVLGWDRVREPQSVSRMPRNQRENTGIDNNRADPVYCWNCSHIWERKTGRRGANALHV